MIGLEPFELFAGAVILYSITRGVVLVGRKWLGRLRQYW
jgi:hypothetical protein